MAAHGGRVEALGSSLLPCPAQSMQVHAEEGSHPVPALVEPR